MQVGTYNFTLAVTDAASVTATKAFTWNVSPLANEYFSLPLSGTTLVWNTPYSQPLLALGGTPPYSWTTTGTMPPGLTLSSAGLVSGTPTSVGFFSTAVQVTESGSGSSLTATLSFDIGGAKISGKVTNATSTGLANVFVQLYNSAGTFVTSVSTDPSGNYSSPALVSGTYYARTSNALGLIDLLYNNVTCAGCNPTTGTPISVTSPATTSNIDFALPAGGHITGTVTDAGTNAALANVSVSIYNATGSLATSGVTDASGNYTSAAGLPTATYFARTTNSQGYVNRLYNNVLCIVTCDVTTGTPISVTSPNTAGGIN
jgi:hypothetical protein